MADVDVDMMRPGKGPKVQSMLQPAGFIMLKRPLAYTFYILLYVQHKQSTEKCYQRLSKYT